MCCKCTHRGSKLRGAGVDPGRFTTKFTKIAKKEMKEQQVAPITQNLSYQGLVLDPVAALRACRVARDSGMGYDKNAWPAGA
jgi:hypothetical protein